MIVLYILGALALLIVLVLLLRVGVRISFGQELHAEAKIGPVKITLLPKPEKKEKKPTSDAKSGEKKPKEKLKLTFSDIRQALPVVLDALQKALGKVQRTVRIDPLRVSIVFGGEDPSRVAEMYGWAGTAVWTLMPLLEQLLHIPDPRIHLEADYHRFSTSVEGEAGISFRIGQLLHIALLAGVPVLRWYLRWQKAKEPAAKKEQVTNV